MYPHEIKQRASQPTLSIRFRSPVQELRQNFSRVYGEIVKYLATLGEHPSGAAFAAYYNMDMQNMEVEAGFTVPKPIPGRNDIKAGTIPGGMYAICHYTGPYDQMGPAYEELNEYITDMGYMVNGVVYEWYLNGPETPPKDLRTDIVFPVKHAEQHIGI